MVSLYKLAGLGVTQTLLKDGPVMVLSLGEIRPPLNNRISSSAINAQHFYRIEQEKHKTEEINIYGLFIDHTAP